MYPTTNLHMCLDLRSTTRLVYVDYITFRIPELLAKYKRLSKACSNSLKCYQSQFENKLVYNGSLGAFYKYVNCKLNGSNGIAPLKDVDGNLVITDSGKASLITCAVYLLLKMESSNKVACFIPLLTPLPYLFYT
jgi:hypothetical protein